MNWTTLMLGIVATSTLTGVAHAVPKKGKAKPKVVTKAKPKTIAKKPGAAQLGMVQMAGDNGQPGVTYTIGKEAPLNFTLKRAEWSVVGLNIGDSTYAPKLDEKLLVLHYEVHNPNNSLRNYDWSELKFTAVDAASNNHEYVGGVGRATDNAPLSIELKPAQRVEAVTAIVVPAKGGVPKLIVTAVNGGVLRYDLRGKVQPLAAPFADPADASGSTALGEIGGAPGTAYPMMNCDVKLVGAAYAPGPFGEVEAGEGKRFLVATVAMRNRTGAALNYDYTSWTATVQTADGEKVESRGFYKNGRNEATGGTLKPGEEYTGRFFFEVPTDIAAKTLYLSEGESRVYAFDVSTTK